MNMARIGHDSLWTILVFCVAVAVFQGCMATTAKPGSPVVFGKISHLVCSADSNLVHQYIPTGLSESTFPSNK